MQQKLNQKVKDSLTETLVLSDRFVSGLLGGLVLILHVQDYR